MTTSATTWTYERRSGVRADADGVFIPRADLSRASIGDRVVIGGAVEVPRRGSIVEEIHDPDTPSWRIALDPEGVPPEGAGDGAGSEPLV